MPETTPMSAEDALCAIMIAVSASDETIRTSELVEITTIVNTLPVFANYDEHKLSIIAQTVFDFFEQEDGLDALFGMVRGALPDQLYETAYALACDVAAADGSLDHAPGI